MPLVCAIHVQCTKTMATEMEIVKKYKKIQRYIEERKKKTELGANNTNTGWTHRYKKYFTSLRKRENVCCVCRYILYTEYNMYTEYPCSLLQREGKKRPTEYSCKQWGDFYCLRQKRLTKKPRRIVFFIRRGITLQKYIGT